MRLRYILLFLTIFVIAIQTSLATGQDNSAEQDNWGKVIGQIVDAQSMKPVQESLGLEVYDVNDSRGEMLFSSGAGTSFKSDSQGVFERRMAPGKYFLLLVPLKEESEYCVDANPFNFTELYCEFTVHPGKITRVFKKAYKGGNIKFNLVDEKGNLLNPDNYEDNWIGYGLYIQTNDGRLSDSIFEGPNTSNFPKTKFEGRFLQLYPGIYHINFEFEGMGYGSKVIRDIVVKPKETVEIKIQLDQSDQTGVQGRVVDQKNQPIKDVKVSAKFLNIDDERFAQSAQVYTDSMGRYRIIGLNEGSFKIYYFLPKQFNPIRAKVNQPRLNVYIKKNLVVTQNVTIEIPEN